MNKNKELSLEEEITKKRNYIKWINIVTVVLIISRLIEVIAWLLLKSPNIVLIIIGNTFFTIGLTTYTTVETIKTKRQIKNLNLLKENSSSKPKIKNISKENNQKQVKKIYKYSNNNSNINIPHTYSKKKTKKLKK